MPFTYQKIIFGYRYTLNHKYDFGVLKCLVSHHLLTCTNLSNLFNPKNGQGGVESTPPLDIFCDHSAARNFLTAPLADFLLSSLAHLMTPFSRKSGHTVTTLHDLLYKLVRPKMAQKRDFVYKVNANGVFSPYS